MPGYRLTAWLRPLLTLVAMAGVLSLAACGGGNGAPSQNNGGTAVPLSITPNTATVYSGNPSTFLISGGKAPYTVISSDQSALPVVSTLNGNTLVVVPGNVGADTSVTLNVRDSNAQTTSATVTVRPALLLPASITITGNPNCGSSGATLCSGQDGSATVQLLGPAGAPLAGRDVRFDVVQGDFGLSSTAPGQPVVNSLTVTTDQNGNAAVRIVVPTTAATQIATLRATDVTGGSSVTGQFTIAQFVDGSSVLSVIPTGTTTFTGPDNAHCASGTSANFFIFGGTPPYTVSTNFPQVLSISGAPVLRSGGAFTVTTNGNCFENATFAITDATGRVLLNPPTVTNQLGTATFVPDITLTPKSLSATCSANAANVGQILATGGTGTFTAIATPGTGASGGPIFAVADKTGLITLSVGPNDAHGDFTITVTSGSKSAPATLTCLPAQARN